MLDIRATHYPSPLSEVEFESIPLTVHIVNVADETGLVSGKFRVYNDTTGLLIHSSDIAPFSLAAGAAVDAPALTNFEPPAALDDTYFVIFDGNASNALVPDGIHFVLGKFDFDVKPVGMGPAPATHHLTHEEGGGDMIEVGDMGTAELDDTLVLQPDGAGGVEWAAAPGGVTDHGALTGLADDDHPQYKLRNEMLIESELFTTYTPPWLLTYSLGGFTGSTSDGTNHPGILQIASNAAVGSGVSVQLANDSLRLGGSESTSFIFQLYVLSNLEAAMGFRDAPFIDSVDGVWAKIANVGGTDGVLVGKTASNSAISTTATSYTLLANTWYRLYIAINAAATRVDFYLYSAAGALLWTDNLTTNIPTGAGRETGHAFSAYDTATVLRVLCALDYMNARIARTLTR